MSSEDGLVGDRITGDVIFQSMSIPINTARWSLDPSFNIAFYLTTKPPCWFHRKMQTLFLGIYWEIL